MALSRKEEKALVKAAQQGSETAYNLLFEDIVPSVEGWVYYTLIEPQHAEDVCQEALSNIFNGLKSFDSERPLKPWCRAITFNTASRYKKRLAISLSWTDELEQSLHAKGSSISILEATDLEDWIDLKDALAKLDPESRAILIMRLAGVRVREIADRLDLSKSTAHRRLDQAREALKKELDD